MRTKMLIKERYVTFETNEKYNSVTVNFIEGDRIVEQVFTCLGPNDEKEEKYFVDMTEFIGRELEVEVVTCHSEWGHYPEGELAEDVIAERIKYVRNEHDYTAEPYSEPYRPKYHYTTQRGWINDPNGCLYYDGLYHMYYQHCPGSIHSMWDNNHWGHAVSTDLIAWEEFQPPLRYPHEASGTGFMNRETGKVNVTTSNRIYESDDGGFSYELRGINTAGNGDPKIFWHEESQRYISITLRDIISYSVSSSPDLKNWRHESDIEQFRECPEMCKYRIEGTDEYKWVLNGGDGAYMIGQFDGHEFIPDPIEMDRLDRYVHIMEPTRHFNKKYNGIFIDESIPDTENRYTAYAHQNFDGAPDGRHIRIAWFTVPYHELGMPFTQAMTIPQELKLRYTPLGLRLCAQPVPELYRHHNEELCYVGPDPKLSMPSGDAFDCSAKFDAKETLYIANYTIKYLADEHKIAVTHKNGHTFTVPFIDHDGEIAVRVLFDTMMCEFFFGDGEVYFPHPSMEQLDGIEASITNHGTLTVASVNKTIGLELPWPEKTDPARYSKPEN